MAKRFTDTEKWKKPFLRSLKAAYKLLWIYILDECDHAGIWQVDMDVAQIKIGEKIDLAKAIDAFGDRIEVIECGDKWFIRDFIDFQYGTELNPGNKAHNSVIKILRKYGLIDDNNILVSPKQAPSKPLASTSQGLKDKDKDMDMDKEQANDLFSDSEIQDGSFRETSHNIVLPFQSASFCSAWNDWVEYRKQRKIAKYTEKGLGVLFNDLRRYPEQTVIVAINRSIKNNWQGLFPDKVTQADIINQQRTISLQNVNSQDNNRW